MACWPRRGEPWTVAEDRRLLRLAAKHTKNGRRERHATPSAIVTRLSTLAVVKAHQRSA